MNEFHKISDEREFKRIKNIRRKCVIFKNHIFYFSTNKYKNINI